MGKLLIIILGCCSTLWCDVSFNSLTPIPLVQGTHLRTERRSVQNQPALVSYVLMDNNRMAFQANDLNGALIDTVSVLVTQIGAPKAATYVEIGDFRGLAVVSMLEYNGDSVRIIWYLYGLETGEIIASRTVADCVGQYYYNSDLGELVDIQYSATVKEVFQANLTFGGDVVMTTLGTHERAYRNYEDPGYTDSGQDQTVCSTISITVDNGSVTPGSPMNSSEVGWHTTFNGEGGEPVVSTGCLTSIDYTGTDGPSGDCCTYLSYLTNGSWTRLAEIGYPCTETDSLRPIYLLARDNPANMTGFTYCWNSQSPVNPSFTIREKRFDGTLAWTKLDNFGGEVGYVAGSSIRSNNNAECVLILADSLYQIRRRADGTVCCQGGSPLTVSDSLSTSGRFGTTRLDDGSVLMWLRNGSTLQRWRCCLDDVAASDAPVSTTGFSLQQNMPNPFNPVTRIDYSLAAPGTVKLAVYDVRGRLVRTLADREEAAGAHHVEWNGTDETDRPVASGVYLYHLDATGSSLTRKCLMIK
jgi:hypothetical protein